MWCATVTVLVVGDTAAIYTKEKLLDVLGYGDNQTIAP
jgi:hypothetical protein